MLLSAARDQAAMNVEMLDEEAMPLGLETYNKCAFLVTEVNAEERMLQVSGCRCLRRQRRR